MTIMRYKDTSLNGGRQCLPDGRAMFAPVALVKTTKNILGVGPNFFKRFHPMIASDAVTKGNAIIEIGDAIGVTIIAPWLQLDCSCLNQQLQLCHSQ